MKKKYSLKSSQLFIALLQSTLFSVALQGAEVTGDDALTITDDAGSASFAASGSTPRLLWDGYKKHFQAGINLPGYTEVGEYTFAFGLNNVVSGSNSFASGSNLFVTGWHSVAFGEGSVVTGDGSFASGEWHTVDGDFSFVSGSNNGSDGYASAVFGLYNYANSIGTGIMGIYSSVVLDSSEKDLYPSFAFGRGLEVGDGDTFAIGRYNSGGQTNGDDYLFVIGNGTSTTPGDAFVVDDSGNVWAAGSLDLDGGLTVSGTLTADSISGDLKPTGRLVTGDSGAAGYSYLDLDDDSNLTGMGANQIVLAGQNDIFHIVDSNNDTTDSGFVIGANAALPGDTNWVELMRVTEEGNVEVGGSVITLGKQDDLDQGTLSTEQRALVHETNDELHLNYAGDFEGGVVVGSDVKVEGNVQMSSMSMGVVNRIVPFYIKGSGSCFARIGDMTNGVAAGANGLRLLVLDKATYETVLLNRYITYQDSEAGVQAANDLAMDLDLITDEQIGILLCKMSWEFQVKNNTVLKDALRRRGLYRIANIDDSIISNGNSYAAIFDGSGGKNSAVESLIPKNEITQVRPPAEIRGFLIKGGFVATSNSGGSHNTLTNVDGSEVALEIGDESITVHYPLNLEGDLNLNGTHTITTTQVDAWDAVADAAAMGTYLTSESDGDSLNEINQTLELNGTVLELTDAGGLKSEDLSSLIDDADADPTNELIATIDLSGTELQITENSGSPKTKDLSGLLDYASKLSIPGGGATAVSVDATGKVGIGTSTPSETLSVNGKIEVMGGTGNWGNLLLSNSNEWGGGGGSLYPTIGSTGSQGSLVMLNNPHITWRTDNMSDPSWTGKSAVRMQPDGYNGNYWDMGLYDGEQWVVSRRDPGTNTIDVLFSVQNDGDATLAGDLTVNGNADVTGNLSIEGTVTLIRHGDVYMGEFGTGADVGP